MKLVGNLKKKVEGAKDVTEIKKLIEDAGMELSDDEVEEVTGGYIRVPQPGENDGNKKTKYISNNGFR